MKIKRALVYMALTNANLMEGEDGVNVRDAYSGRGMFGTTCFGVDFDITGHSYKFVAALALAMAEADEVDGEWNALELADAATTDSMGRGMILYFPGWTLED